MFLDPIQKRALSRSVHLEAVYLEALLYLISDNQISSLDQLFCSVWAPVFLKFYRRGIGPGKYVSFKVQFLHAVGFFLSVFFAAVLAKSLCFQDAYLV